METQKEFGINKIDNEILRLSKKKGIAYFPLRLILGFLIFTEILFFIGPLDYSVPSRNSLFIYLAIVNIACYCGYRHGVKTYKFPKSINTNKNHNKFISYCIIISFILLPFRIISLWGIHSISPTEIINHIQNAIQNPGDVYSDKLDLISGFPTYLCIIMSPVIYITTALCIFYYSKLQKTWKILALLLILWEYLLPIGQGVRKGILDISMIVFFIYIAKRPHILLDVKLMRKYVLFILIFCTIFISYFIYSNLSRYGIDDAAVLIEGGTFNIKDSYLYNTNPIVLSVICSIESYLCQGYYALGNALYSDFTCTFGFGSSWFGINFMNRLGIDLLPYTYIGELEKIGIDPTINWHSIYTWLASDFTFVGVPIFIYIMGYLFSVSWLDTLIERTKYAPAMFILFTIMFFYSFANNQVFSLSFIAFVVISILWLRTRYSLKYE